MVAYVSYVCVFAIAYKYRQYRQLSDTLCTTGILNFSSMSFCVQQCEREVSKCQMSLTCRFTAHTAVGRD